MQCQHNGCTTDAHPLYLPWCEDHWCEHSRLPSSVGHSISHTHSPRRQKQSSDDTGYTAIEKAVYR